MTTGELYKKLDNFAQQWVGYFWGRLSTDELQKLYSHQHEMKKDYKNVMIDVQYTTEEAKRELLTKFATIGTGKRRLVIDLDTFEKWFGSIYDEDRTPR